MSNGVAFFRIEVTVDLDADVETDDAIRLLGRFFAGDLNDNPSKRSRKPSRLAAIRALSARHAASDE